MSENLFLRYEPRLIEEAVFYAQRNGQAAVDLGRQRNHIYEIADPEERERLFRKLYGAWFVRLGLKQPIEQAFREQPLILSEVKACLIGRATKAADEGAELFVHLDEDSHNARQRTVRVLLRPEALLSRESLLTLLRHELFHIADMLDPAFAYVPDLPASKAGPTYDSLLQCRYTMLWDTAINGRMVKRGWLADSMRQQQLGEFVACFPMLQQDAAKIFSGFFDQQKHTHAEFVAFAQNPRAATGEAQTSARPGGRCALCNFPTHAYEKNPDYLDAALVAAIHKDFPQWYPHQGLCQQCADLYRARHLSSAAARAVPGWQPCLSNE